MRGLNVQLATASTPTTAPVVVRADSAYYLRDVLATALRHQAWFSVTAR